MDFQDYSQPSESEALFTKVRLYAGAAVVLVGLVMSIYIFLFVYRMIKQPDQIALFTKLMPNTPEMYSSLKNQVS